VTAPAPVRIAVIGHIEYAVIARVRALPAPGDILHLGDAAWIAGGGGGITFAQLAKSPAELHLFTAFGDDEAAAAVRAEVESTGARVYAGERRAPQTRDLVLVTDNAERTILVIGDPLHARADDALPWHVLGSCHAVFYTGTDPELLRRARAAELLVVTARRRDVLDASGVQADVVVGSENDPREASHRAGYAVPPRALVMTEGRRGGAIETASGIERFRAAKLDFEPVGVYGAGDSFAGALTWYLACGRPITDACARACAHGAAVLRGWNPLAHQLPLVRV
jgi:ribokinase